MTVKLISWTPGDGSPRRRFPPGTWSVSRVRNAAKCLRAYNMRYNAVEARDADTDHSGADLGTAVHAALENTYAWIDDERYVGTFPRRVVNAMLTASMRDAGLFNEDLFDAARRMVMNHAVIHGDVDFMRVLGVEVEFMMDIGGVRLGGYIDRVEAGLPSGEPSADDITVYDTKTSKWLYTEAEVESDLQAAIYMAAAAQRFPGKRIHFVFDMLRYGLQQETEHDEDREASAIDYIRMIVARVAGPGFPASVNPMCAWCDYKSSCEGYQRMLADDPRLREPDEMGLVDLIEERHRLVSISMATRQRAMQLESAIKRPLAQMEKERRRVSAAMRRARKAAAKAKAGKSAEAIEQEAMRRAAAELNLQIHEMHEIMGRASLHAGPYAIRCSRQRRPSMDIYDIDDTIGALVELGICDADTARKKIVVISPARLSRLITEKTRKWSNADRTAARLEIEAMSKMGYETRLDIRKERSS